MTLEPFWSDPSVLPVLGHLFAAWLAGSLIGLERSHHGRPAGFRTHALVCLASALLMLVTTYQWEWIGMAPLDTVRTDPTRMAQGIMTGIGFLGAGVIFKEGLSVRGLTTSASIWITAGIGILLGVGFFFPAIIATLMTLGTLSAFRWIEAHLPTHLYAHHRLTFAPGAAMAEQDVRALLKEHGFKVSQFSYRYNEGEPGLEYRMVIQTIDENNVGRLADSLTQTGGIRTFRIDPTGD